MSRTAEHSLRRLGFEACRKQPKSNLSYDLVAGLAGRRFVVTSMRARNLSTWTLGEPLLRICALAKDLRAHPLLVVQLGTLPAKGTVAAFAKRLATYHLENLSWLLVDESGGGVGAVLGKHVHLEPERAHLRKTTPAAPKVSFTDSAQRLLKHLLLGPSPEHWWDGNAPHAIPNANQLAEATGISPATAYRVMKGLEAAGYVVRERWGEARLEHPEALIEEWSGRYRITDNRLLPFRPDLYALPQAWRNEVLHRLHGLVPGSYALTAYTACEVTGTQRTRETITLHIYAQDIAALADTLDIVAEPEARGRDLVYLIRAAFPRSVFEGAATVNGLRVVDPLQCYLDLYHHYEAGREQAEYLFVKVIRPRLEALLST